PKAQRDFLTGFAAEAHALPLLKISEPVVETGIYDSAVGTALVLANFTYQPIESLTIELPVRNKIRSVSSLEHGAIRFETMPASGEWLAEGYSSMIRFQIPLTLDDLILLK